MPTPSQCLPVLLLAGLLIGSVGTPAAAQNHDRTIVVEHGAPAPSAMRGDRRFKIAARTLSLFYYWPNEGAYDQPTSDNERERAKAIDAGSFHDFGGETMDRQLAANAPEWLGGPFEGGFELTVRKLGSEEPKLSGRGANSWRRHRRSLLGDTTSRELTAEDHWLRATRSDRPMGRDSEAHVNITFGLFKLEGEDAPAAWTGVDLPERCTPEQFLRYLLARYKRAPKVWSEALLEFLAWVPVTLVQTESESRRTLADLEQRIGSESSRAVRIEQAHLIAGFSASVPKDAKRWNDKSLPLTVLDFALYRRIAECSPLPSDIRAYALARTLAANDHPRYRDQCQRDITSDAIPYRDDMTPGLIHALRNEARTREPARLSGLSGSILVGLVVALFVGRKLAGLLMFR